MTNNLAFWEGKQRWIEARAALNVKFRGMTPGEALDKAKEAFAYFMELDRRAGPGRESNDDTDD